MDIVKILREQEVFRFTGNLNFLLKKDNSLLGQVKLKEGFLVSCTFNNFMGTVALKRLLYIYLSDQQEFRIASEPEIVEEESFKISIDNVIEEISNQTKKISDYAELRPPKGLELRINPAFIKDGSEISEIEMDILLALTDYRKVEDVYNNVNYYDPDITKALVDLRKKEAVIV